MNDEYTATRMLDDLLVIMDIITIQQIKYVKCKKFPFVNLKKEHVQNFSMIQIFSKRSFRTDFRFLLTVLVGVDYTAMIIYD